MKKNWTTGRRDGSAARLRWLLATSSLIAVGALVGAGGPASAVTPCIITDSGGTFGPVSNSAAINCINIPNSTVNGSVTNTSSGTITPSSSFPTGIAINNSTVNGGIANAGTITATSGNGIGINVFNGSVVTGTISNTGTITANQTGVLVTGVSTFAGGISNGGTINSMGAIGININTVTSFGGGITNGGTILGCGKAININSVTVFSGGISNGGKITSGSSGAIAINSVSTFIGNISNAGTISGARSGININSISIFNGSISNGGTISGAETAININSVSTFTGGIASSGLISSTGSDPAIRISSISTFAGGISITGGTITAHSGTGIVVSSVSSFSSGIFNAGTIAGNGTFGSRPGLLIASVSNFSGGISNTGTIKSTHCGDGIRIVNVSTFSGGISNGGTISGDASLGGYGVYLAVSTFLGGITNTGLISGRIGIYLNGEGANTTSVSIFDSGTISGSTIITGINKGDSAVLSRISIVPIAIQFGSGVNTLTLGPGFSINGNVLGSGHDIFQLGGTGNGLFDLSTIGAANQYQGFTTFNAVSGSWTVFNTFGQTNPWTVQGGTLLVDGNLSSASSVTVNSGGTLGGNGILPSTTILSGGTLAPGGPALAAGKSAIAGGGVISSGNVLTIQGNLVMASAAAYLVQVSPTNASRTNVTGTAGIAGTLTANASTGTYTVGTQYTVLNATGGVSGTFTLTTTGSFGAAIRPVLSYDSNDVFLTLDAATLTPLLPPGATLNEREVAGAIDTFILGGGTVPPGFQNIFNFSPQQIQNALNQLTGEVGTGADQSAFQLMTEFLDLLSGPPGGGGGGGGAMGFAPERETLPPDVALAYASVLKAPPAAARSPMSVWASGYGGTNTTNGDPVVGSSDVTTRTFGVAAGLDYQIAPDTKVGFALAGAGTGWSLSGGLGSGKSDAFQAGVYGTHRLGPAYISAALAGTNFWMTTNRTVANPALPVDQLNASFNAQSFGGRLEGGYRIPASVAFGVTPYAAAQFLNFLAPSYRESGQLGPPDPFALSFASRQANATRTELGSRFDTTVPTTAGTLGLFARLAWAHDVQSDPTISPAFLGLPTPSFVINGATPRRDKALVSGGGEWRLPNGWLLKGKFNGEFASGSSTYAGTAEVKYTW